MRLRRNQKALQRIPPRGRGRDFVSPKPPPPQRRPPLGGLPGYPRSVASLRSRDTPSALSERGEKARSSTIARKTTAAVCKCLLFVGRKPCRALRHICTLNCVLSKVREQAPNPHRTNTAPASSSTTAACAARRCVASVASAASVPGHCASKPTPPRSPRPRHAAARLAAA